MTNKQKPIKNAGDRRILILIGIGKSSLAQFTLTTKTILGIKELIKKEDLIKSDCLTHNYCVHLNSEDDVAKIPAGIKRRSAIFYINF